MVMGAFLFIKFKVVEGFLNNQTQQRGEPRIQVLQIEFLQDVLEKLSKKVTFHLNIEDISQPMIDKYRSLVSKHKGKQPVYFVVHHKEDNIHLNMDNAQLKVSINNAFLDELEAQSVVYNLNNQPLEKFIAKKVETQEEEEPAIEELGLSD